MGRTGQPFTSGCRESSEERYPHSRLLQSAVTGNPDGEEGMGTGTPFHAGGITAANSSLTSDGFIVRMLVHVWRADCCSVPMIVSTTTRSKEGSIRLEGAASDGLEEGLDGNSC